MNRTPLPALATTLRTLGSYGDRLVPADATPEQLRIVARALDEARRLLATASGATATGCDVHPAGPVDPTDGKCLLCRSRRHRPSTNPAAAAEAPAGVSAADVVRTIAQLGEQEAVRRYGGRAVTRATASAGRGTHRYPLYERPARRDQEESNA